MGEFRHQFAMNSEDEGLRKLMKAPESMEKKLAKLTKER